MSKLDPGLTNVVALPPVSLPVTENRDTAARPAEHRFVIRNLDWVGYKKIAEALTNRHFHIAYDGQDLELMTTSFEHSGCSRFLYRLVLVITEEMLLPVRSAGDMTQERDDIERAVEPDESFYFKNEALVRGKAKLNMETDPPPELSIEIEITRSSLQRMKIYAQIGVPEYWRCNGETVRFYHLDAEGNYQEAPNSLSFPFLTAIDLSRFVQQRMEHDENSLVRSFRTWVREQLGKQG